MGKKLYKFYIVAGEMGGVKARTELSIRTKISSTQAKSLPDEEPYLSQVEDTWNTISKEFNLVDSKPKKIPLSIEKLSDSIFTTKTSLQDLKNQISLFSDFIAQRALYQDDLKQAVQRLTEMLVDAVKVERASIWFYYEENGIKGIDCFDLFEKTKGQHSDGVKLSAKDFPSYFEAVESEKTIIAEDAHTHKATREFSEVYLAPLGIGAMLDVPIWVNNKMKGVICHEHVGGARKWTEDEENFAYLIGHLIGMMFEYSQK